MVRLQLFFTLVFTYPSFPQSLALPTGLVDLEVWKNVMITLEGPTNATFAKDTYTRLVPEPAGPQVPDRTNFWASSTQLIISRGSQLTHSQGFPVLKTGHCMGALSVYALSDQGSRTFDPPLK